MFMSTGGIPFGLKKWDWICEICHYFTGSALFSKPPICLSTDEHFCVFLKMEIFLIIRVSTLPDLLERINKGALSNHESKSALPQTCSGGSHPACRHFIPGWLVGNRSKDRAGRRTAASPRKLANRTYFYPRSRIYEQHQENLAGDRHPGAASSAHLPGLEIQRGQRAQGHGLLLRASD